MHPSVVILQILLTEKGARNAMRASDPVSQNLEPGKKKGKGIFIFTQCYQTWLNSAKVAYFKSPWRVKNGGVSHHKCGLFLGAPRFWLNMAKIQIFPLDLRSLRHMSV